ncbi:Major facilitator superfamily (MFS) profile domain-containing protein [Pleurotus pulmonarius]
MSSSRSVFPRAIRTSVTATDKFSRPQSTNHTQFLCAAPAVASCIDEHGAIYRFFSRDFGSGHGRQDAPHSTNKSEHWRWLLTLSVCLAVPVLLETLDYTVVATAQPHIASAFNRLDLQSYIGTVYLLTSTAFLPLFASLSDVFGRHFALQLSLFIFMIGSAISTGAFNIETMLAGRAIAGVGAAGLLTIVRVIVSDSRSLDSNNWQTTLLFFLYTVGYVIGPVIGGALVGISFRWIFAINLPCCTVSMILSLILLRNKLKDRQAVVDGRYSGRGHLGFVSRLLRIDWVGAFIFIAGGLLLLLALNWGSNEGWNSAKVVVCFVLGGLLIVACLFWEWFLESHQSTDAAKRQSSTVFLAEPMIPLAIFKSYDVCAVLAASFVSGMVMIVMLYFVAIFMTIATGLSATNAGVQLLYFAPGMGGGSLLSSFMIKHLRQPKYPILFGGLLLPIALGLISMAMQQDRQNLVKGFMVLAGVGIGVAIGPLAIHARFSQPAERLAIVSAMLLFFRSFGGTIGLAQCAAVLNAKVRDYLQDAVESGAVSAEHAATLASIASSGGLSSVHEIDILPPDVQDLVRNAFRNGVRWAFVSLIPWAAVAFLLTVFLTNLRDEHADEGREVEVPKSEEHRLQHISPSFSKQKNGLPVMSCIHGMRILEPAFIDITCANSLTCPQ